MMFNGMYAGIAEDSVEGWRDEDCIKAELKKRYCVWSETEAHVWNALFRSVPKIGENFSFCHSAF